VRILLATVLVAGCGFEHGLLLEPDAAGGGGGPGGNPGVDAASSPVSRTCKFPDSALRLCIEFDNRQFTPKALDGSPYQLDALANHVTEGARGSEPAASTFSDSSLTVPESAMLDIKGTLYFETWVYVPQYQDRSLLSNAGQYGLRLDGEGRISCQIGTAVARTPTSLTTNTWHHVACGYTQTYAGPTFGLAIDGVVTACAPGPSQVPTAGTGGTVLAAQFNGMIDDVRIYSRLLDTQQLCMHADRTTGCALQCPQNGPGPEG
jgi:hypothetical protein